MIKLGKDYDVEVEIHADDGFGYTRIDAYLVHEGYDSYIIPTDMLRELLGAEITKDTCSCHPYEVRKICRADQLSVGDRVHVFGKCQAVTEIVAKEDFCSPTVQIRFFGDKLREYKYNDDFERYTGQPLP